MGAFLADMDLTTVHDVVEGVVIGLKELVVGGAVR